MESLSEIPVSSSLCLKLAKPLILMFCSLLMDVSDPGGSKEDVGGVVKEVISLLTFSKGLDAILETAMWELQSTFFMLGPELSFLKPCLSLVKGGKKY